jgi:hypothetical protein
VFVTRLHVRYDADHFPEDLVFQQTGDRTNFQGRYVLRHAWTGRDQCEAASAYRESLRDRREREAQTLASLTGWEIQRIREEMLPEESGPAETEPEDPKPWWERIWSGR